MQLKDQKTSEIDKLQSFLTVLAQTNTKIVFVLDNIEDLIENDKVNFRNVVRLILVSSPFIKVVLTSRVRMASLPEINEEIFVLSQLSS